MMRMGVAMCVVTAACGGGGGGAQLDAAVAADSPADAIGLTILEAYGKAWNEPDAAVRGRLLVYSAIDTLTVHDPSGVLLSRDAVDAAMVKFQADVPGGSIELASTIREQLGRIWLRWEVFNANHVSVSVGLDLMKRAADMRLERVHSFFGTLPITTGSNTAVQQALIDAWNEPDPTQRTGLLATAVTDDVVVAIEGEPTVLMGSAAFSTLIGDRLAAAAGAQMSVTSGYLTMPDAFHVAWHVVASDGTTSLGAGVMMGLYAADGRIAELDYFNGAQP